MFSNACITLTNHTLQFYYNSHAKKWAIKEFKNLSVPLFLVWYVPQYYKYYNDIQLS